MPMTDASNPVGMMGQQAPAMGTDAPQGAGLMAAPAAGLPPMQPGTPQAAMALAQIASKLLEKQKGQQYMQTLLKHLSGILSKSLGAQILDDNPAKHDVMDAIKKLETAGQKMTQAAPSKSPAMTTVLSDIAGRNGSAGATM